VLPFWADAGFDGPHARFHELSTGMGSPRRCRTVRWSRRGKSMFFYSCGPARLVSRGGAARRSRDGFPHARFSYELGQAGELRISIRSDGRSVSPTRNAYAHAFVLFAIGGLHRLNGNPQLLALADRVIASMSTLPTASTAGSSTRFL
jgi:mannose/cellobiose epimerase-like protein (N-acyl-D-glucosamine 2-epimerase family)